MAKTNTDIITEIKAALAAEEQEILWELRDKLKIVRNATYDATSLNIVDAVALIEALNQQLSRTESIAIEFLARKRCVETTLQKFTTKTKRMDKKNTHTDGTLRHYRLRTIAHDDN